MAVAFDAQGHVDDAVPVATLSSSTIITVGSGSNRALIVGLCFGNATGLPTGITVVWDFGGSNQSMTAITNAAIANTDLGSVAMFGLIAPVSGQKTLKATWTGSRHIAMGAISFTGVDQTGGATSFPNGNHAVNNSGSTTASVTITSATGNMTAAYFCNGGGTNFSSTSATQDWLDTACTAAANHTAGSASNVMTATVSASDTWVAVGCDILAAGSGPAFLAAPNIPILQAVKRAAYW